MAFWITSVSKVGQKCCGSGASAVAEAGITSRRIGYSRRGVRDGLRHRDGERPALAISAF